MGRELKNRTIIFQRLRKNLIQIGWHLLGIGITIGYQILSIVVVGERITFKGWLTFLLQILTFYANLFWVIPKTNDSNRRLLSVFRLLTVIVLHVIVRGWIIFGPVWKPGFWGLVSSLQQLTLASMQLIFVMGLSFLLGLYYISERRRLQVNIEQQRTSDALEEKLRVECIMSQLQLSPHYLFNSLNYVKVNTEFTSPGVAKVTDLLADILRHTLIDISNIKKVSLASEVDLVQKHIQLHKELTSAKPCLDYIDASDSQNSSLEIPPSILLTLTENVLKYAVLNDPDLPASIEIRRNGALLLFYTFNHKRAYPFPGRGRGLNSIRSILKHYYPDLHTLDIHENEEWFKLTLKLKL